MAQLSDDCFAFGGPMMPVDEAVGIIAARVKPVREVENVALEAADGRILARDIAAPLPLPPFTNSAVDGYAVRSRDLPKGAEAAFAVTGRVQAGASAAEPIQPGQAMRIFTGAPMPEGADTVFMQEDVRLDGEGRVVLPAGLKPGANVRPAGEDIPIGTAALGKGRRLRPQDVALAAAFGLTGLDVTRRIRVAVFSTGNELVSPGSARRPAQLFDSNRFMLMAMLAPAGLRGQRSRHPEGRSRLAGAGPEAGGRRPRFDPDHRRRFDRRRGPRQGRRRKRGLPGAVAHGDQTGPSGGDGNHRWHAVHWPSGKSGGEFRHLRPCGAADRAGTGGRGATADRCDAGSRGVRLQEEDRRAANMSGSACAGRQTVRWRRRNFRARARACCRRWWTPTGWSNSARKSRWSNRARASASSAMQACCEFCTALAFSIEKTASR